MSRKNTKSTTRKAWARSHAQEVRNATEDRAVEVLEEKLAHAYSARRGRIVIASESGIGWAWCAGCGAVKCAVDLDDREAAALVEDRASALCAKCEPDDQTVQALAIFLDPPAIYRPVVGPFDAFVRGFAGRATPEAAIRRYAAQRLDQARATVARDADHVAKGGTWVDRGALAILRIAGTPADVAAADALDVTRKTAA